ncbi:hypothetical protein [Novosphingobium aquimarinum]|uniref:hypothetical protein n=1 Tax=Novosphingobium aquimarinum TaxID=2682494 RepID=UPI0012EBE3AB|nr:hypothetical protein [Novosphingobium aquimarinum]
MLELLAASLIFASAAAGEPATKQPTEETAEPTGDDRIKCKRLSVTGSLTQKVKTCRTIAEWRRLREGNSDYARDLQDYTRTRSLGGP